VRPRRCVIAANLGRAALGDDVLVGAGCGLGLAGGVVDAEVEAGWV